PFRFSSLLSWSFCACVCVCVCHVITSIDTMLIDKNRPSCYGVVHHVVRDSNNNTLGRAGSTVGASRAQSGHRPSPMHPGAEAKSNTLPRATITAGEAGRLPSQIGSKPPASALAGPPSKQALQQPAGCRAASTGFETGSICDQEQCAVNATLTIRRLLHLYELGEYREAAVIISRLPYATFRAVVLDLPVDLFVEAMPASLP